MIPNIYIEDWSNYVKWQSAAQIEQDLIISRALIDLYNEPHISVAISIGFLLRGHKAN